LKEWFNTYQELNITDFDRLNESHYFLCSAYALFLQYSFEIGYITERESQTLFASFFELMTALVEEQQARVEQGVATNPQNGSGEERHGCLHTISKLYRSGSLIQASRPSEFKDCDCYDCVIHNNYLCIRVTKFEDILRNAGINDSEKQVLQDLELNGALLRAKDGRPKIQINAAGNKRFVAIHLDKL
jgi:hypothetical protein